MTDITKATNILRDIKDELDTAINCLTDGQDSETKAAAPSAIPASFANFVPEANRQTGNLNNNQAPASTTIPTPTVDASQPNEAAASAVDEKEAEAKPAPIEPTESFNPEFAPAEPAETQAAPNASPAGDITTRLIDTFNALKGKITPDDVKAAEVSIEAETTNAPQAPAPEFTAAVPPTVAPSSDSAPATPTPAPVPDAAPVADIEPSSVPTPDVTPAPTPVEPAPSASFDALNSILNQSGDLPSQDANAAPLAPDASPDSNAENIADC